MDMPCCKDAKCDKDMSCCKDGKCDKDMANDTDKNEPPQSSYTRIPIEVVDSAQITPLEKPKPKPKTKSEPEFIIDISM
jgi:hypothetical protein